VFDYATGKIGDYDMVAQVITQSKTVILTLVWSGVGSAIIFTIVKTLVGLRPGIDQEREGLDLVDHGERAYNY
jgi:Amt family ammonium transporter